MSKKKDAKDGGKGLRKPTTRRQFLKVAGIGGLSAASLYLLGCAAEETTTTVTAPGTTSTVTGPGVTTTVTGPGTTSTVTAPGVTTTVTATPPEITWDKEVDVVVIGTGTIVPAALVAAHAGLEVLMLEKAEGFGGTSATSGGGLWIALDYLTKEAGVEDSRAAALTYLRRVAEGQSSEELRESYVDNGNEMLEWLRDNAGFTWKRRTESPGSFPEYYPYEGALPGGLARGVSISREDGVGSGRGLWLSLKEACDAAGIEIMTETPGKRLIYKGDSNVGDGEVIGVIAESFGQEIAIKARRGVIIGTGGFEHNAEMRLHFLRAPVYAANSPVTNTGDGHLMGMAVGADLRNMNENWGLPFFKSDPDPDVFTGDADWQMYRGRPGAITVNKHGERIGNESANYDVAEKAFHTYDTGAFEWRNIPSFFICDAGFTSRYYLPGSGYTAGVVPEWFTVADSLDEMATALGINAANLAATVERFNGYAGTGVDLEFHRGETDFDIWTIGDRERTDILNTCLAPLETPPYCGATIWPGTTGTNGGLRTNGNAQVLNVWGKVIPRLYCSSNTMASVHGVGYAGGGATLGSGMTFAYVAGKHVITLASW